MLSILWIDCKSVFNCVQNTIKELTEPVTALPAAGVMADMILSRKDRVVENVILGQQLIMR